MGFRQTEIFVLRFKRSEYAAGMIKLETLRVFTTVAAEGNIRDAARRLGRTPSAVSMALKQLEAEIGAPLFATDRKNTLTELGAFVFESARAQIGGFDRMVEAIRAHAEGRVGRLCVACVPSVAATLMPGLIESFLAERPGIEIELLDVHTASVAALVDSGEVDFGVAGRPGAGRPLVFQRLFEDDFMVICHEGNPLTAEPGPLTWEVLAGQRLIRNGASDRLAAAGYARLAATAPLMVRNVTSLLAMVSAGLGITLLPALTAMHLPPSLVALPLADEAARREVGIVEREGASRGPAVAAFLARLAEAAAGLDTALTSVPRGSPPDGQAGPGRAETH